MSKGQSQSRLNGPIDFELSYRSKVSPKPAAKSAKPMRDTKPCHKRNKRWGWVIQLPSWTSTAYFATSSSFRWEMQKWCGDVWRNSLPMLTISYHNIHVCACSLFHKRRTADKTSLASLQVQLCFGVFAQARQRYKSSRNCLFIFVRPSCFNHFGIPHSVNPASCRHCSLYSGRGAYTLALIPDSCFLLRADMPSMLTRRV